MGIKIPGRNCAGCNRSSFGSEIEIKDEGASLGTASILNFEGEGVTVVKTGSEAKITIPGSEGGSFEIVDYTDFEAEGLPTGVSAGYLARIVTVDPNYVDTIDGVQYVNNTLIYYTGTHWISWPANYGATT